MQATAPALCLPLRANIAAFPPGERIPLHAHLFRNVGIDSAMNNAYSKIGADVCLPPLVVVTRNEHATSTIQEGPQASLAGPAAEAPQGCEGRGLTTRTRWKR